MTVIAIGNHRLFCGDITDGAVRTLMGNERADIVYSDPPWGPGNQRYWHTHNGTDPRTDWMAFLDCFAGEVARYRKPDAPVLVEMGLRWTAELDAAMMAAGLPFRRRWRIFYGPKSKPLPNALCLYGPRDLDLEVDGMRGEPITSAALAASVSPGDVVLDPCAGLGMTARVTHALGGAFRGCEMNQKRLDVTAAWLRRKVAP